jgi:branched-chain amino acid transport system permease protein
MTRTTSIQRRELVERFSTSFTAVTMVLLACVALVGVVGDSYITVVAISVATYAALALGLNVVMGYAGLLDMGYVAFFAIGAYAAAICTALWGLNFLISVPIAIAVTSLAGIVIGFPTLRLRPDYLAIVTIGFGELARTAVNNWEYVGASRGIYPLPVPAIAGFSFDTPTRQLLLAALLLAVAIVATNRMGRSRIGRAWRAIRDDDFVASAVGLPTLRLKIGAYVAGGAIGALAGSIFAARSVAIDPTNFTLLLSVQIVMMVVLGGLGSVRGVLLAAVVFIVLPEALRAVQDFRLLFFSIAVIILVSWRPQGVIPERKLFVARYDRVPSTPRPEATPLPSDGERRGRNQPDRQPPQSPLLTLAGVSQQFAGLRALDSVTLSIPRDRVIGIIGPNGAGKTTLINAITGVRRCSEGRIELDGRDITALPPHKIAKLGLARTFQATRLFETLTVLENVMVSEYSHAELPITTSMLMPARVRRHEERSAGRAMAHLHAVGLEEKATTYPGELSYADRRRVEIARALNLNPSLLILDEPAAGMNPTEKQGLQVLLRELCATGVTIILIEHDMPLVSAVADDVVVLVEGRVMAQGSPREVLARPDVIEAYLGKAVRLEGGGPHA